jgi:plasmid stabilization system protein ParE
MAYSVVRSKAADDDIENIFHHLIHRHLDFGHSLAEAVERADNRLRRVHAAMEALGLPPFQGTRREGMMKGLRSVTKEKAIFYFTVDEAEERIHVLAVFFSGQDHLPQIVARLKKARG